MTGLRKSAWQQTKMPGLQQGLSPRRVIIGETELKHQISCQVFPTSSLSSPRSLVWDPVPVARLSAWNTDVIIIVLGVDAGEQVDLCVHGLDLVNTTGLIVGENERVFLDHHLATRLQLFPAILKRSVKTAAFKIAYL